MSRSTIVLANLDFEDEFSAGSGYIPTPALEKLTKKWSYILRLLPGFEGALALQTNTAPKQESMPGASFLPWGWTPSSVKRAQEFGCSFVPPSLEVVFRVNEKTYSHEWEQRLGVALPMSRIVRSMEGLQTAIVTCPYDWVLKHPLGVSGRGRLVGKAQDFPVIFERWVKQQFKLGWELIFEPWVQDKADFSLHYDVWEDGSWQRVGSTQLVTDKSGGFRGNRVTSCYLPPVEAWEPCDSVVSDIASRGYVGPVGFDCLTGSLNGKPVLRPIVEINARHTFGRLALTLQYWVPNGWHWLWWHPPESTLPHLPFHLDALPPISPNLRKSGFYRLPEQADPGAQSKTLVLLAESPSELQALEGRCFAIGKTIQG